MLLTRTGSPHSGKAQAWIDLADPEVFDAFAAYGLDSISLEAFHRSDGFEPNLRHWWYGGDSWELMKNHDAGWSLSFELTDSEFESVQIAMTRAGVNKDALEGPFEAENVVPK